MKKLWLLLALLSGTAWAQNTRVDGTASASSLLNVCSQSAITAASEVGNVVTISTTLTMAVGDTLTISGVTPAGYNGTFTVSGQSSGTISYTSTQTGLAAGTSFGWVVNNNCKSPNTAPLCNSLTDATCNQPNPFVVSGPYFFYVKSGSCTSSAPCALEFYGGALPTRILMDQSYGGGSGSGTPGGSNTQIQFNNSSAFGGDANLVWDNTANKSLSIGPTGYKNTFGTLLNSPRVYSEYDSTETTGSTSGPFTFANYFNTVAAATSISAAEIFSLVGTVNTPSTNNVNYTSELAGVYGACNHSGSGTINLSCFGVSGESFNQSTTGGIVNNLLAISGQAGTLAGQTGVVNFAIGGNFNIYAQGNSATPIGHGYGVRINGPVVAGATGTTMTSYSYLGIDGSCPAHVGSCLTIDITNAGQNNLGAGLTNVGTLGVSAGNGTGLINFTTSGTAIETTGSGASGGIQLWGSGADLQQTDAAFGTTILGGGGFGLGSTIGTRNWSLSDSGGIGQIGNGTLGNSAGFIKSGQSLNITSNDVTCGTGGTLAPCTSFTTITGLSVALPLVATTWSFKCDLIVSQATAAVADQIGIQTATNGATNMTAAATAMTAAAVIGDGVITDVGSTTTAQSVITFTPGATGTKVPIQLAGTIEGVSVSGTVLNIVALTGAAADLMTIYRGSSCWVY